MATFPEEIDKIGGDAHPARRPARNLSTQDRLDENATPPRALIAASGGRFEVDRWRPYPRVWHFAGTYSQSRYLTFVILPET